MKFSISVLMLFNLAGLFGICRLIAPPKKPQSELLCLEENEKTSFFVQLPKRLIVENPLSPMLSGLVDELSTIATNLMESRQKLLSLHACMESGVLIPPEVQAVLTAESLGHGKALGVFLQKIGRDWAGQVYPVLLKGEVSSAEALWCLRLAELFERILNSEIGIAADVDWRVILEQNCKNLHWVYDHYYISTNVLPTVKEVNVEAGGIESEMNIQSDSQFHFF